MVAGFDRHENGNAQPDLSRVDQRDAARDDAVSLKALQPLPARRRRQADALADLGNRERGVLLHDSQDLPVDGIHSLFALYVSTPVLQPLVSWNNILI